MSGDFKKIKETFKNYISPNNVKLNYIKDCENMEDYAFFVAKISRIGQLNEAIKRGSAEVIGNPYSLSQLLGEEKERIMNATKVISEKTENRYSKVEIVYSDNLEFFHLPIDTGVLTAILYEMVFNASKYGEQSGDSVKLTFTLTNNNLIVKNLSKPNKSSNTKLGVKSVKSIFKKINYTVNDNVTDDGYYAIEIRGKDDE